MKYETRNLASETHPTLESQASSKKGFTIVETLVAITILMIAIAGPLTIANQALHAAQDAKNQLIATNLAQETVEEVRNYKDNFISGSTLCDLFGNYAGDGSNPSSPCSGNGPRSLVKTVPVSGSYVLEPCAQEGRGDCALYLSSDTGYTYVPDLASFTPFSRWFTLSQIAPTEFLLTVTVAWSNVGVGNQVQLQDLLSASTR